MAYYVHGVPQVVKSASTAIDDRIFNRVSGVVSSNLVIAHIRKATVGDVNLLNSHPFQHGAWTFAHNGEISNWEAMRQPLFRRVAPVQRRFILGTTDSEMIFHLFLTHLAQEVDIQQRGLPMSGVAVALERTVEVILEVAEREGVAGQQLLNIILSNGNIIMASRMGKSLWASTYKKACSERHVCPSFSSECENPADDGVINHIILSSEQTSDEDIWLEMPEGRIIAVDWRMNLREWDIGGAGSGADVPSRLFPEAAERLASLS